jgi:hypothetical protein
MSARILLSGTLATAAVRRKRRVDNHLYAVCDMRDTDRGETRRWRVYANDLDLIEREELRVGEPIACSGPFYVGIEGDALIYRRTVESLIDTKRRRKPKGRIAKESRVESDELGLAPVDPEFNDPLPDWGRAP